MVASVDARAVSGMKPNCVPAVKHEEAFSQAARQPAAHGSLYGCCGGSVHNRLAHDALHRGAAARRDCAGKDVCDCGGGEHVLGSSRRAHDDVAGGDESQQLEGQAKEPSSMQAVDDVLQVSGHDVRVEWREEQEAREAGIAAAEVAPYETLDGHHWREAVSEGPKAHSSHAGFGAGLSRRREHGVKEGSMGVSTQAFGEHVRELGICGNEGGAVDLMCDAVTELVGMAQEGCASSF